MEWVEVPPGTFLMGNPNPEIDEWDEAPVHQVTLSRGFAISREEITVAQYQKFRPDYVPPPNAGGYAVGISWHDAMAYCAWLSEREGKPVRLPTEAEWEWAARLSAEGGLGGTLPLKNMLSGPREWCLDVYGPYPEAPQVDPLGRGGDFSRVIRGGGDARSALTARITNRSSYGANYRYFPYRPDIRSMPRMEQGTDEMEGLVGNWFGRLNFTRPRGFETILDLHIDWDRVANNWSGRYFGFLLVDRPGRYTFRFESDHGGYLELGGERLLSWVGRPGVEGAAVDLEAGRVPMTLAYFHDHSGHSFMRVSWKHELEEDFRPITRDVLRHTPELRFEGEDLWRAALGSFAPIGFRVVRGPHPETAPSPEAIPFPRRAVAQKQPLLQDGPEPETPHFRRRYLLPVPPDNVPRQETRIAGFHPVIMNHNHSPALTVLPNGDVLWIAYSSEREYEPETTMITTRLRFGAEAWDMPDTLFDFADANEHAPCLFTDYEKGVTKFFWGTPSMEDATPFQWTVSTDNGATWSEPQFPVFPEPVGAHSRQPISGPFYGRNGTFYLPSDARLQDSVLWASDDGMRTWRDTGGRSAGRHTVYVELKDGRIMALGGKNTDIDGLQPVVYSSDGGRTWSDPGTLPFPALGGNQRPALLRLQSGRLFYAGDLQHRTGEQPPGFDERGTMVALSEDEGETWIYRRLPGGLPHVRDGTDDTLGYASAAQGPNGLIHVTSTMTHPCLHFELNEAWILDGAAGFSPEPEVPADVPVQTVEEWHADGGLRSQRGYVHAESGEAWLHGPVRFFFADGQAEYTATYDHGRLVGEERSYAENGQLVWHRIHREDGASVLLRYDESGRLRSETHWQAHLAHGPVRWWDGRGNLIVTLYFDEGRLTSRPPGGFLYQER